MYEIQVNVGLNVSDNFPALQEVYGGQVQWSTAVDAIFDAMSLVNADRGLSGIAHRLDHSATEPTLVMRLKFETVEDIIYFITGLIAYNFRAISSIGQDCIAVYRPDAGLGVLVGAHADEWGTFNKDYFIEF